MFQVQSVLEVQNDYVAVVQGEAQSVHEIGKQGLTRP